MDKANRLSKNLSLEEKKNCDHNWEKEYCKGSSTGDYACTKCGSTIWEEDFKKGKWSSINYY